MGEVWDVCSCGKWIGDEEIEGYCSDKWGVGIGWEGCFLSRCRDIFGWFFDCIINFLYWSRWSECISSLKNVGIFFFLRFWWCNIIIICLRCSNICLI